MNKYKTNIHDNALQGLYNSIHQAASKVRKTLGAAGKNVGIEIEAYPYHEITNDGATIIEHMHFEDPIEKMGLQFLKEVVGRSNKNAGDGSSTTTVLVEAILENGMTHNGIEVKRSLDACIPLIEESINKQKRMITSDDFETLKQVATISSEDEIVGELLADIYGKIGAEGIIEPEYVLGKEGNSYEYIQAIRFANQCGLLSHTMVHDEEAIKENRKEIRAVYDNPVILVTKQKIQNLSDIQPAIRYASIKEKDLVIFTDDIDSGMARILVNEHTFKKNNPASKSPRITLIKAPTVWKQYVYEDFAKCVGATIISDTSGILLKNIKPEHFGTVNRIVIEKEEVRLIGTQDISEHIAQLKAVVESGNDHNDDALRRVGWLTAKTVLLKIGGLSETEITYKRLKLEDAINATRSALTDGIVAGGGVTYLNVALSLDPSESIGKKILHDALMSPINQIAQNAGINTEGFMRKAFSNDGWDANTGEMVDMFESGIIDSAKVALNAMKNAIGIASTILTIDSCITLPPKKVEPIIMPPYPMMQ